MKIVTTFLIMMMTFCAFGQIKSTTLEIYVKKSDARTDIEIINQNLSLINRTTGEPVAHDYCNDEELRLALIEEGGRNLSKVRVWRVLLEDDVEFNKEEKDSLEGLNFPIPKDYKPINPTKQLRRVPRAKGKLRRVYKRVRLPKRRKKLSSWSRACKV